MVLSVWAFCNAFCAFSFSVLDWSALDCAASSFRLASEACSFAASALAALLAASAWAAAAAVLASAAAWSAACAACWACWILAGSFASPAMATASS